MPQPEHRSLWDLTAAAGLPPRRFLADHSGCVSLADLNHRGTLAAPLERFRGQSVLVSSDRQVVFALALLQLEGLAARIVLCPPDLAPMHLPAVMAEAQVDVVVCDGTGPAAHLPTAMPVVAFAAAPRPHSQPPGDHDRHTTTQWLLFTSGTTARPKLVVHTLASLTGPLDDRLAVAEDAVWCTFYDVRRYGGLQILLRALLGGGSMVLSQSDEPVASFLTRAGECRVTHISGTPSHWRRALMSSAAESISPRYIRLSGEVADQAILNHLAAAYPAARITHAFASTEAGVAFDVSDGLAGFPKALIGQPGAKTDLRIENGSLRIRSARTASRYLGDRGVLADAEGFVDTGDTVVLRGDRYYFVGRREGVINVGGQKVHPEEVEAVISQHPGVRMARVHGRPSPITGALVVADIVVQPSAKPDSVEAIKAEILVACQAALPAHKVPAMLRAVTTLDIAASGKLARRLA
ncbi:MAG: acyl--CoA ligase [Pseudomonadota bacterium]|nr:acyl--CoA ligase [Pseudomonadota bacterium]